MTTAGDVLSLTTKHSAELHVFFFTHSQAGVLSNGHQGTTAIPVYNAWPTCYSARSYIARVGARAVGSMTGYVSC